MRLWVVLVEDLGRGTLDRVLIYAAVSAEDAATMARGFYRADGRSPAAYRFAPQPVDEVSGPDGTPHRILVQRCGRAPR
jgi:hypothetical protein